MTDPIGYATLQVIPSLQGVSGAITSQLVGPMRAAGRRAGTAAGDGIASGIESARSAVDKASEKIAAARRKEEDAAGKVRIAEANLEDLRARGITSGARFVRATEALGSAQRNSAAQTDAARRAAEAHERALRGLEDAENDAGGAAEEAGGILGGIFSDGAGSAIDKLKGLAAAAGGIGIAITAGMASMDAEVINDRLAASLGATPQQAEQYGRTAANLYRNAFGESLEEVSESVGVVASSFNNLGTNGERSLEQVTETALNFAGAFGTEVPEAVQTASQLIQNGLAANSTEAFDLMTTAFQRVPSAMRDELPEILQEYGTNFRALGFTGEGAFATLVTAAENGKFALDKTGDALKEFTIRGSDMSEASKGAYEAIGLNAEEMSRKIAAGGAGAQDALQRTARGLLNIEDPATRANTAIALFGTPLEDLSIDQIPKFLEGLTGTGGAMDGFAGSADRMGTTLNDNTAAALESFKRSLQGGLVDTLGGMVLFVQNNIDTIKQWGTVLGIAAGVVGTVLLPQLAVMAVAWTTAGAAATRSAAAQVVASYRTVGGWVAMAASAALNGATIAAIWTATQVSAAAGWVAMQARAVGAFVATGASAVAQAAVTAAAWVASMARTAASVAIATGAFVAQRAILVAGAIATGVMSAAQWALNAAMTANPIGIIIALLAGLVAGVVLAYRNSETFRNIVQAAWEGIKVAASFAWNNVLKPALDGLLAALGWVGDKAMWLWQNVMVPAWDAIRGAIEAVWNFIRPILDNIGRGIQVLGEIASKVGDAMRNAFNGVVDVLKAPIHMVGRLLSSLPEKVGPITIPFVGTLKSWGSTLQGLAEGGVAGAAGRRRNGQLWGPGTGTSDSILGIDPATLMPTAFVANGEGVVIEEVMSTPTGSAMVAALNSGWVPSADQMHAMFPGLRGYAAGGVVGEPYGLPAGTSISYGGSGFPDWVTKLGAEHNVKPSTYPGHQESDRGEAGYAPNPQGLNRGIDWSGTVEAMQGFADYLLSVAPQSPSLEQIIWQNPNTGVKVGWHGRTQDDGSYFAGDYGGHQDHVHSRHSAALEAIAAPALPQTPQVPDTVTQTPQYAPPVTTDPGSSTTTGTGTEQKTRLKTFKELGSEAGGILAEGIGETLGLPDWVMDPNKLLEGDDGSNVRTTDNTATQQQQQAPTTATPPQQTPAQPQQQTPPPVDRRAGLKGHAAYVYDIAKAALDAGVGKAGAIIGEATALVEVGDPLRMLANSKIPESLQLPHDDVGDNGTSTGLFQQQDNGAWGTLAQRMNAYDSAGMFYDALKGVSGWETMDPGAAAQAVQRSAFPDKYGAVMDRARQLVDEAALFDTGGIWQPGTLGFNGLNEPELVLKKNQWGVVADQTKAVRELVGAARGANTGGGLAVTVYGHTAGDIVTEFRREQWRGAAGYGSRGR
ncbi:tape measure protein [Gordonia phage Santhid]|uniref:Tape measure protein n=1 Tax=Gordonia phage Santhid TaxID=2927281 RepID=A0AAE9GQ53_9CAUD|nr:tape measure protein [Gordonia phage Santhid]UOK18012.1 tape measure protein [Gordonia phage Santhid]